MPDTDSIVAFLGAVVFTLTITFVYFSPLGGKIDHVAHRTLHVCGGRIADVLRACAERVAARAWISVVSRW